MLLTRFKFSPDGEEGFADGVMKTSDNLMVYQIYPPGLPDSLHFAPDSLLARHFPLIRPNSLFQILIIRAVRFEGAQSRDLSLLRTSVQNCFTPSHTWEPKYLFLTVEIGSITLSIVLSKYFDFYWTSDLATEFRSPINSRARESRNGDFQIEIESNPFREQCITIKKQHNSTHRDECNPETHINFHRNSKHLKLFSKTVSNSSKSNWRNSHQPISCSKSVNRFQHRRKIPGSLASFKPMAVLSTVFMLWQMTVNQAAAAERCIQNTVSTGGVVKRILKDYDQHLLPDPNGVNVTVEVHVQEIGSVSEITADFELDLMYSEIWNDARLAFHNLSLCTRNFTMKSTFRDKIWVPDTCIINSKEAKIHSSPSENMFIILYEDGTVWANFRMKVRAPCRMNLRMFPFDTQFCSLVFESYSFNAEQVLLRWDKQPITMMGPLELPDFNLESWETTQETLSYPNGIWDRLNATFTFRRRHGYYLFQAYFPTFLTVISSWIGFLLETRSVSARITLGVSSLLAISFQFGTVLRHLPRVSYIKCMDVWMIGCVIFIFLTMMELGLICQLNRREREAELSAKAVTTWIEKVRASKKKRPSVLVNGSLSPLKEKESNFGGSSKHRPTLMSKLSSENSSEPLLSPGPKGSGSQLSISLLPASPSPLEPLAGEENPGFQLITPERVERDPIAVESLSRAGVISSYLRRRTGYLLNRANHLKRSSSRKRNGVKNRESGEGSRSETKSRLDTLNLQKFRNWYGRFKITAALVDSVSTVLFPAGFVAFLIIYSSYIVARVEPASTTVSK